MGGFNHFHNDGYKLFSESWKKKKKSKYTPSEIPFKPTINFL